MILMKIKNLFEMGNYTVYVWSAYGVSFLVLMINLIAVYYERKQVKKIIRLSRRLRNE